MKTWKFTLAFFAASLMANSPLVYAATDANVKREYNQFLKNQVLAEGATLNSFYSSTRNYMDSQSQAITEAWLENFGTDNMPKVESQMIKDKNGRETLKLIISKEGVTGNITISEDDDYATINGQKFYYLEAANLSTVVNRLAANDSTYKALALEMNAQKKPASSAYDVLTLEQFMKLKPIKKVEYLSLYRGVLEAAQRVNYTRYGAMNEAPRAESYASTNGLHPLFASSIAIAADRPADGTKCIVAGNVSEYRNGSCFSDPSDKYNQACVAAGAGNVACNPLVYGFKLTIKGNGTATVPHCLNRNDQPRFTQQATADCNQKSPLKGEPGTTERNQSYRQILTTYYSDSGGKENFGECFNEKSESSKKCAALFAPQLEAFKAVKEAADLACQNTTLPDQPDACANLKQRALDLAIFAEGEKILPAPIPVPVIVEKSKEQIECEKDPKNKWNQDKKSCEKPAVVAPIKEEKPKAEKKKCEKGNKSIKCNPALLIPIVGGILALILLLKGKKKKKPPTMTTIRPTTPTTMKPPSEGGNGTPPPAGNGGVR